MRRLYIHIGMPKAGSTAIQTALLDEESALKRLDILNPTTGRRRGAHWSFHEAIRGGEASTWFRRLSAESRDYAVTVISCEAFWNLSDDEISHLAAVTDDWDVHVMLYLRRPGSFLGSSYRQRIKSGKAPGTAEAFLASVEKRLAYDDLVSRWSRFFPLTVRVYDRVRSRIEEDFFECIGAGDVKPHRIVVNGTPSDGAARLMRAASKVFQKRSKRLRINRILLAVEKYVAWMPPIDNTLFHRAARRAVANWDRDVLQQFLTAEDIATLAAE